jgi:hypothetical protein
METVVRSISVVLGLAITTQAAMMEILVLLMMYAMVGALAGELT